VYAIELAEAKADDNLATAYERWLDEKEVGNDEGAREASMKIADCMSESTRLSYLLKKEIAAGPTPDK
jgi:hypothetical protein